MIEYTWIGEGGDSLFENPKNWSPRGVPGFQDSALLSNHERILVNQTHVLRHVVVDDYTSLIVVSGTFAVTGILALTRQSRFIVRTDCTFYSHGQLSIDHSHFYLYGLMTGSGVVMAHYGNIKLFGGKILSPLIQTGIGPVHYEASGDAVIRFAKMPDVKATVTFENRNNHIIIPVVYAPVELPFIGVRRDDRLEIDGLDVVATSAYKIENNLYRIHIHPVKGLASAALRSVVEDIILMCVVPAPNESIETIRDFVVTKNT